MMKSLKSHRPAGAARLAPGYLRELQPVTSYRHAGQWEGGAWCLGLAGIATALEVAGLSTALGRSQGHSRLWHEMAGPALQLPPGLICGSVLTREPDLVPQCVPCQRAFSAGKLWWGVPAHRPGKRCMAQGFFVQMKNQWTFAHTASLIKSSDLHRKNNFPFSPLQWGAALHL